MNTDFKILVVDDEKHNRVLLAKLLQDDHSVILAKNGVQALTLAQEHHPDLILIDILMPDMDGFDAVRALKNQDSTRHIPVIFISSLDAVTDEEQGLQLGAVDYITKPFHPPIVLARVRNHLQAVHQRRLLEQLALIDSLTEVPNRRRLDVVLQQEWRRCQRNGQPLSLMVIDVDHFKAFNDTLGHAAGDTVLRRVAQTIKAALKRPADFVARYGGEEFVVLLPEVDQAGAQAVAAQLRDDVQRLLIPHPGTDAAEWLSISLGGATQVPESEDAIAAFFAQADASLYHAKRSGRNRVVWATAPGRAGSVH